MFYALIPALDGTAFGNHKLAREYYGRDGRSTVDCMTHRFIGVTLGQCPIKRLLALCIELSEYTKVCKFSLIYAECLCPAESFLTLYEQRKILTLVLNSSQIGRTEYCGISTVDVS